MPSLPESWGLTTKPNERGTLDVLGKDDLGNEYKVRTTDTPGITDTDITELRAADRESYSNRTEGARNFVSSLVDSGRKQKESRDNAFHDDLLDASCEIIGLTKTNGRATSLGMIELPATFGSNAKIRRNWPFDN